jgi:hypothetical protein
VSKLAETITYLFAAAGEGELLAGELTQWLQASARFTRFVETYRDKIRKKIRNSSSPESLLDLRAELEVAYRLLDDRRFAVAYEPYASEKRRGPDFAVTYRANQIFNIEVARMRIEHDATDERSLRRNEERILRIFLDKLGQMQAGMPNLLVIQTPEAPANAIDLGGLMQSIKVRAEAKDPAFYDLHRYAGPAAYFKDFLHAIGILLWAAHPQLWVNKQARPALDEKILRLVLRLAADPPTQ